MAAPTEPAVSRLVPRWVWAGALVLALVPLVTNTSWLASAPARDDLVSITSTLRLLVEVAALWLAARSSSSPAVRQVLLGLAGVSIVSTVFTGIGMVVPAWSGSPVDRIWYLLSYALGAVLFFRWPRLPGPHVTLVIDTVITAGGLGVLMWVFTVAPNDDSGTGAILRWLIGGGEVTVAAQVLQVIGLNVLVLRGQVIPTRAGFWWFLAGQIAYVPSLLFAPLADGGSTVAAILEDEFYLLGVVPTVVAAFHFRAALAAAAPPPLRRVPAALELNPVALLTPVLLAAALAAALVAGRNTQVLPLGLTLVIITLLLVGRLVRSAWDNARLARERAAAERQLQAARLEAVGRLAGGVAHEFNNLMHSVIGYAELAAAGVEPDHPIRADLRAIEHAGTRAAELTAKLLQFSGRQPDLRQDLDVSARVRAASSRLGTLLPAGHTLALDLAPAARAYVDPHQLDQLLTQLVANAAEAVRAGGEVALVVRSEASGAGSPGAEVIAPGPGPHVVLEVVDTGVGIGDDELRQVFEPFFTTRPVHEASGLGLAAVYGIVVAHGGGLAVTSALGRGTRVTVRWPVGR